MIELPYDKTSAESIWLYSKGLLGQTLRQCANSDNIEAVKGKGSLGEMVEKLYFYLENNNRPEPDFVEAGLELKCTPLKKGAKDQLLVKERLVCGMIDYIEEAGKDFEHSHFYVKCRLMLLLFYLHVAQVNQLDLEFLYSVLWKLPEKDLLIMRHDYEVIHDKIVNGLAHTLSEGDTMYLAACRKGAKGTATTQQYNSTIPAPTRAFSLKTAYMRTILEYMQNSRQNAICNFEIREKEETVSEAELSTHSFDEIILSRFQPYLGKGYSELAKQLHVDISKCPKNLFAIIASAIASGKEHFNVNKSDEFLKAGLMMKAIRVQANGTIKEAMAFENIDYQEVYDNDDWFESRLYEIFSNRLLFVVFKEQTDGQGDFALDNVFFWTMPQQDLEGAAEYWEHIRANVLANQIDDQYFWKASDKKNFHVRPKARDSQDLTENPNGGMCKKFCYWFNNDYVRQIVNENSKQ